jgi:hypothetical protein
VKVRVYHPALQHDTIGDWRPYGTKRMPVRGPLEQWAGVDAVFVPRRLLRE